MIFTLCMQTAAAIWWASTITEQLSSVRERSLQNAQQIATISNIQNIQQVAAGRIEQSVSSIKENVDLLRDDQREIASLLRQLIGEKK